MGRIILLLTTMVSAMVIACAGVVLAQQTTTPETTTPTVSSSDAPKTPNKKISGSYIVVLKDNEDPEPVVAKKKQEIGDLNVKHVYKNALKGFAVDIPDEEASKLRDNPEVKYVEQDQEMALTAQNDAGMKKTEQSDSEDNAGGKSGGEDSATTPGEDQQKKSGKPSSGVDASAAGQKLPWGIDKIDGDLSSTKSGDGSDEISDVNVYIIDTGVGNHRDLNKVGHVNFAGGKNDDCNGHGTHVAGTVAAKDDANDVVGVAPGAPITGVKVLNCAGTGTTSGVIAGVDYVTVNAKQPAVANMSLGGGKSQALDDAVTNSAASGVFYALAAGNEKDDACNHSPARAGKGNNGILTVGATDQKDHKASFSNTNAGGCIDIWAPGINILSTKRDGGTTTMSGTSMASPHGAGAGALYLSKNTKASPTSVEGALVDAGQPVSLNPDKRLLVSKF